MMRSKAGTAGLLLILAACQSAPPPGPAMAPADGRAGAPMVLSGEEVGIVRTGVAAKLGGMEKVAFEGPTRAARMPGGDVFVCGLVRRRAGGDPALPFIARVADGQVADTTVASGPTDESVLGLCRQRGVRV